jgi:hypothetical protein
MYIFSGMYEPSVCLSLSAFLNSYISGRSFFSYRFIESHVRVGILLVFHRHSFSHGDVRSYRSVLIRYRYCVVFACATSCHTRVIGHRISHTARISDVASVSRFHEGIQKGHSFDFIMGACQ